MPKQVYINKTASFLPNDPIPNEEMEDYLGLIGDRKSRARPIVLRNNGIKQRFYARNKNGKSTHTNAEMAALAVKALFEDKPESIKKMDLLCCGSSSVDQLVPSHGVMVHGWLPESNSIEVISPAGNCCSGMHALKYAYMSVSLGFSKMAVSSGSERCSAGLQASFFKEEAKKLQELGENPYIAFEKDFLRWMLSDGAGAFCLQDSPNPSGISLRIEWMEAISYAHEVETCMYMGAEKLENGELKGYGEYSMQELLDHSILSIKQDVKLLRKHIISTGFGRLKELHENGAFNVNEITYFLPHISSEFFRPKLAESLKANGMEIPMEKWFLNLERVGNVGAASIYLMLDELFNSGKLQPGNQVLLAVPESARFSYVFALLTVV